MKSFAHVLKNDDVGAIVDHGDLIAVTTVYWAIAFVASLSPYLCIVLLWHLFRSGAPRATADGPFEIDQSAWIASDLVREYANVAQDWL